MAFVFSDTPYDGVPFSPQSHDEITEAQYKLRVMLCAFCGKQGEVNFGNVVANDDLVQNMGADPEYDAGVMLPGRYKVVCPHCLVPNPISTIEGES